MKDCQTQTDDSHEPPAETAAVKPKDSLVQSDIDDTMPISLSTKQEPEEYEDLSEEISATQSVSPIEIIEMDGDWVEIGPEL
jgi:hypothetical protein